MGARWRLRRYPLDCPCVEFTVIERFSDSGDQAVFETEVCIVGSGAAGITLARRLASAGLEVCLLESGGADYEQSSQDLGIGGSDFRTTPLLKVVCGCLVVRPRFGAGASSSSTRSTSNIDRGSNTRGGPSGRRRWHLITQRFLAHSISRSLRPGKRFGMK